MSKYFFDSPMKRERLIIAAEELIGTPFCAHGTIPGAGLDCVHCGARLYQFAGFWGEYGFPDYTLDEGKHLEKSKVLEWIEASGRFQLVAQIEKRSKHTGETPVPLPGDLLCFAIGKQVQHHIGVMINSARFIHVLQGKKVNLSELACFKSFLTHVFRPLDQSV